MAEADSDQRRARLAHGYAEVRGTTETLAAPLSAEDQTVQSMPDVSPTKWHRGHTSWFFETFLLAPHEPGYGVHHPAYGYIFNSYYEAAGSRHPRADRGLVSRPGIEAVAAYRRHVDEAMAAFLGRAHAPEVLDLVELGLHHEQQHQELLLMDIKHVLWCSPLLPAYTASATVAPDPDDVPKLGWVERQGGAVEIGHRGAGFAFDNESPRHRVHLEPFAVADRLVTCGEWSAFIDDGGYARPELWLSDGWATVQQQRWTAPLYWSEDGEGGHRIFTLAGERAVRPSEPVCHVSYYEADAFARWCGARLPTEAEWEEIAATLNERAGDAAFGVHPGDAASGVHPGDAASGAQRASARAARGLYGDVWQWTASAYSPYPGFRPAGGAVGEYNGKFMVNQQVLRGSACVTPPGHARRTYRNFFPAGARWAFSGLRLARDL